MKRAPIIGALALVAITGCSAEQRTEMETTKLESFDLTPDQRVVADALVTGFKAEMGLALLRSREYARAACYAKKVVMPRKYKKAHLFYLANYDAADRDFYPFMQKRGVTDIDAWEMSKVFRLAYEQCTLSGALKRRSGM